jgi:hypothetical protein
MSYDDWKLSTPPDYDENPLARPQAERPYRKPLPCRLEDFDWTPAALKPAAVAPDDDIDF